MIAPSTGQLILLGVSVAFFAAGMGLSIARVWEASRALRIASKVFIYLGIVCAVGGLTVLSVVCASPAHAQAIITNGSGIYLGVDLLGQLNIPDGTGGVTVTPTNSSFVGLYSSAIDGDGTSPG